MKIKISMHEGCADLFPAKAHSDDAAYDLRSRTDMELPVGKSVVVPTGVYIELPPDFEARRADLDAFADALKSFYSGDFAAARAAFEKLRDGDPVSGAYARKCRALEAEQPASWDGVWVMTEK